MKSREEMPTTPEPKERKDAPSIERLDLASTTQSRSVAFVPLEFVALFPTSTFLPVIEAEGSNNSYPEAKKKKKELPRKPHEAHNSPTNENRLSGTLQRTELGVCPPLCSNRLC